MSTAVAVKTDVRDTLVHDLIVAGDTSHLNAGQKTEYFLRTCETLGLNPVTQPFAFIKLNGKEVLYAKKDATEQLRKVNGVSVESMDGKIESDIYIVTVKVRDKEGRTDVATGAVNIKGLVGDGLANAIMKAETKAKRRATLSICGLGILDETEIETIPGAGNPVEVNMTIQGKNKSQQAGEPMPKSEADQAQNPSGPVVAEGELIPAEYWKKSQAEKQAMLAPGCKAEKLNGKWICVRKQAS